MYAPLARQRRSVKVRDELMDVKVLEQVDDDGLEQWRPVLKAALPALRRRRRRRARRARRRPRRRSTAPRTPWRSSSTSSSSRAGVGAVAVHKRRAALRGRRLHGGADRRSAWATRDDADDRRRVGGPGAGVAAVARASGSPLRPNVSLPRGLKALAGFGARRYAVIDVGTNSVKFHIAERARRRRVADRSSTAPRSPGSARVSRRPAARSRADARGRSRRSPPWPTRPAATARRRSPRSARQGCGSPRTATSSSTPSGTRTGVEIEVISGEEESRLAYLAVKAGARRSATGSLVVFDTGGGSSQFTFGSGEQVDERFSVERRRRALHRALRARRARRRGRARRGARRHRRRPRPPRRPAAPRRARRRWAAP